MRHDLITGGLAWWPALALCGLAACAAEVEPGPGDRCAAVAYPAAPAGFSSSRHVVPTGCVPQAGAARGSAANPHRSLAEALAVATPGTAVLLAAGRYEGPAEVALEQLALVGVGAETILHSPAETLATQPALIHVQGVSGVLLAGLQLEQPAGIGIWLDAAGATLEECVIDGTTRPPTAPYGYGLLATGDSTLTVRGGAVRRSASVGALLHGGEATFTGWTSSDNGLGGLRLEQQVRATADGCTLQDNRVSAIAVFSADLVLRGSRLERTVAQEGQRDVADGLVVSELLDGEGGSLGPSRIEVAGDNVVADNARVGVLLDGAVTGSLSGSIIEANRRAGLWLQRGAGSGAPGPLLLADNTVRDNDFFGIAVISGAGATLTGNEVSGTREGDLFAGIDQVRVGDGVGLYGCGVVTVTGNRLEANARAGLLADRLPGSSSIQGNRMLRNGHGIVLQNPLPTAPFELDPAANELSGNGHGDQPERLDLEGSALPLSREASGGFGDLDRTERGIVSPGDGPPE